MSGSMLWAVISILCVPSGINHGTKSLSGYVKKLQAGGYRADADPVQER